MTNKVRAEIIYDRLKNRPDAIDWLKLIEEVLNEAEARGRKAGLEEALVICKDVSQMFRAGADDCVYEIQKLLPLRTGVKKDG